MGVSYFIYAHFLRNTDRASKKGYLYSDFCLFAAMLL